MLRLRSVIALATPVLLASSQALAQTAAPGGQPQGWMTIVMYAVPFAILYFLIFRPQAKKQQSHKDFLTKLQRGEEVLTSGGVLGRIEGLTEMFATLEIAPGVRIKVLRTQIASYMPKATESNAEVKA